MRFGFCIDSPGKIPFGQLVLIKDPLTWEKFEILSGPELLAANKHLDDKKNGRIDAGAQYVSPPEVLLM